MKKVPLMATLGATVSRQLTAKVPAPTNQTTAEMRAGQFKLDEHPAIKPDGEINTENASERSLWHLRHSQVETIDRGRKIRCRRGGQRHCTPGPASSSAPIIVTIYYFAFNSLQVALIVVDDIQRH